MRVCVASAGRFHTFDLARQLAARELLAALYTAYPRRKVDGPLRERVRTFPWLMVPTLAAGRLRLARAERALARTTVRTFGRWVGRSLEPCDVFHALSAFGLEGHRAARARFGAVTVCDRGSAHVRFQDRLLAAEHARWGAPYAPIDPAIVERELTEYDEADLVFVPSSFSHRTFVEEGVPAGKLRVVPYGVDLSLFRAAPQPDDALRVLYVGELSLQKGLPYLLEALAPPRPRGVELWLAGRVAPEVAPLLRRHAGTFRHLGFVPRAELARVYAAASVLVLPSVQDGFGLVMAQAMACGRTVIASEHTGAADLYTDGVEGFIVPIRDAAAIRERVLRLHEDRDLLRTMQAAALERVRGLGGWDDYAATAIDAYGTARGARPDGALR